VDLFNRLVVTLLAALLLAGSLLVLLIAAGWLPGSAEEGSFALRWLAGEVREVPATAFPGLIAAAAGSAVAGLVLLWIELRVPRRAPGMVIRRDKQGTVTVSMNGLRRLAEHVIGEIPGVERVVSEARRGRDGVAFRLKVAVRPDASTPELATEIRERMSAAVRHHIGQPLSKTRIDVYTHVSPAEPARRRVQ
jgi:hypothetical protein